MTVIAMTQEMATLGSDVAYGVAQALGLKVVQHEVGDTVAERMHLKRSLIRRVREGQAGWFEKRGVDADVFAVYANEEVLGLALEGNVVIRGWGATYLLSEVRHVPCIRICAPLAARVKWLMERLASDDSDLARAELERSDGAHAARIQHRFGVALADSAQYDMVLNTGRVSIDSCVDQIVALSRRPEFQPTPESMVQLRNLELRSRIRSALLANPGTAEVNITADVEGSSITLRGMVASSEEKDRAAEVVGGVEGVSSVDNQLRVIEFGTKRFAGDKNA
jgi:cytidylate kinase